MEQLESDLKTELTRYFTVPQALKATASNLSHHVKLHKDSWGFTMWKGDEVSFNPRNIVLENELLLAENYNDLINKKCTTFRPKKFEAIDNVILLQGIKESIDRDIGAVSTSLDYNSLGTSATAESESQTDLQAEFTDTAYDRRQFSVNGSRVRVNQTMKLGMLWDSDNFDALPVVIRESGVHWHVSSASKCHARVVSTDFSLDLGDLFVAQINELQENGVL